MSRSHTSHDGEGAEFRAFLQKNDPVVAPGAGELAALESQILAQIDALPDDFLIADVPAPWILSRKWAARSAWAASILFVVLGFVAGRSFDDLAFQAADQETLYASADSTLWQSFITTPSSTGEADDTGE